MDERSMETALAAYKVQMEKRMGFFEYLKDEGRGLSPAGAYKLGRELGVLNSHDQYKRHQGSREAARRVAQRNKRFDG